MPDANRATDEATATMIAQQFGHPVAIDATTTPLSQVSAQPDGSMQLVASSVPVRVKQGTTWVPVNLSLQAATDGLFVPAASVAPVEFSAGGSNLMAKVQTAAGKWVSETWPGGSLPAPQVAGATATYPEVYPGVDLQLTATAAGMSEVLVVKTATAAANPNLKTVQLGISGASVTTNATKSVTATASDGSVVTSASPTWWDSSGAGSDGHGPAGGSEVRPLPFSTGTNSVSLSVASAAATSGVIFPIFVDPEWQPGANAYWFTDRAFPDQSYLNGNQAGGIQSVGNGGGYMSRAFWQFPTSTLSNKFIISARFDVTELWSNTCTVKPIQAWRYGVATPGFTWNTDPNQWVHLEDTLSLADGSTCAAAKSEGFNTGQAAIWAANSGSSVVQIGLRAQDETDTLTRRHFSQAATFDVLYDTKPGTPVAKGFQTPQRGCSTNASAPAWVNDKTVALVPYASTTDADSGDLLTTHFHTLYGSPLVPYSNRDSKLVAPGPAITPDAVGWQPLDFRENVPYGYNVDATDKYATSLVSNTCYFRVDNTPPDDPTATAGTGTVGSPLTVTATSSSDTVAFEYWWNGGATPPVPTVAATSLTGVPCNTATPLVDTGVAVFSCAVTAGVASLTVAPPDKNATLNVAAWDAAGNVSLTTFPLTTTALESTAVNYAHGYAWLTDQPGVQLSAGQTVVPSGPSSLPLTIGTGRSTAPALHTSFPYPSGSPLDFTAPSGNADTTTASATGSGSFSMGAWLYPTTTTGIQTALSQSGPAGSVVTLSQDGGNWKFCVTNGGTPNCATFLGVTPNQWVLVTGIWDSVSQQLRLVKDNTVAPIGVKSNSSMPSLAGPFVVGAARQTATTEYQAWTGQIIDPFVFPGVIDSDQQNEFYGHHLLD
ncbi:LamG-like jellyroll fold domain-containing protein [Diaminobutyricibacter sp. McL0608]|uniref:LamG-like jellyroll fold domain-containing protein n=1 Tax=Leifsonia sp. McL0608 TaxID=3143537 RepID=UPI0031F3288C